MKNFKLARNLWLLSGLFWLIATCIQLKISKWAIVPILHGITCILMFINAYVNHKKIIK